MGQEPQRLARGAMNAEAMSEQKRQMRAVVSRRRPDLLGIVEALGVGPLTEPEREELRGVIADELADVGLGPNDEPNQRGHDLERLIDWLGTL
jgi:hypothetical protein